MEKYNHKKIESKWQKIWEEQKSHRAQELKNRPKFYCLDFFPYPSGDGLHVGHWRGYVLSDIIARYQKLSGKHILHPMGYDAFGLPAENAAIKENSHPKIYTDKAINRFQKQLRQIGAMYDWSREINSSDPSYYKWTQWLFIKLYDAGLAYRKKAPVNFCPSCQTVLANEQVIAGECERCGTNVIKKELTQWFFKITKYSQKLLDNLEKLDWPERTKTLQRNWIGRSEGTRINFPILNSEFSIEVFTTRADTLFGATFMVLAPEHELVLKITTGKQRKEVEKYLEKTKEYSQIFRENIDREKTGVFTGTYAVNPINQEKIPIWVADYVLLSYGTGAVMAVPAHDARDYEFAKKFKLPIKIVICPNYPAPICPILDKAYENEGYLIDSGDFNGIKSAEAKSKIAQFLKKKGYAQNSIDFRLRDWLISRQRYWGAPIPIIYCQDCGEVPVPEKDLPVLLPEVVEFRPTGKSPLENYQEFVHIKCPKCHSPAKRETDTMDTFVDSSWYFLRFTDPKNQNELAAQSKINHWLPVDLYVGGIEHATMHLLYARFLSLALHDLKIVNFSDSGEPFKKLFNIGLIYLNGAKMSKSKGNVVNPDELVEKFGSDALRGYEMFVGPAHQDSQWQTSGISGIFRFLSKVWKFFNITYKGNNQTNQKINQAIFDVTVDINNFRFNTALSKLMALFNNLDALQISHLDAENLNIILSPFFPHLAEEINQKQGGKESIFNKSWPKTQPVIKSVESMMAMQIDGKTRMVLTISNNLSQKEIERLAFKNPQIKKRLQNKNVKKVIFIPQKILNFVTRKKN